MEGAIMRHTHKDTDNHSRAGVPGDVKAEGVTR